MMRAWPLTVRPWEDEALGPFVGAGGFYTLGCGLQGPEWIVAD